MTGFIFWAVLCAAVAIAFVISPLLRLRADGAPPRRILAATLGVATLIGAGALYALWSPPQRPGVSGTEGDSIGTLLAATDQSPSDMQAWLNLGRGYLRIQQWPLARRSYQHADRLSQGKSAAALSGWAESMVFENNGTETDATVQMFDRALKLDPSSPQALFYTGVALLHAGDLENSKARFVSLRNLKPPAEVMDALDKQIAAIDVEIARLKPDPATTIDLLVSMPPALRSTVPTGASLFVFVRAPQGGAPLAVKRLSADFPQTVRLSASDSMIPANRITPGQHVLVAARVSISGKPTASSGDLFGDLKTVAGAKGQHELVIDRRSP